jgi:PleD family two-component response regulator
VASRQPVELDPEPVTIHASVGIAVSARSEDLASLADRADRALYAAKRSGGDRWCLDEWTP